MDDATLNVGFHLAMEWGEDWLMPIQPRLKKLRPELSQKQLNECNKICQEAMRRGHELVIQYIGPTLDSDFEGWSSEMQEVYSWISDENLSRCFSQGCYYAMK